MSDTYYILIFILINKNTYPVLKRPFFSLRMASRFFSLFAFLLISINLNAQSILDKKIDFQVSNENISEALNILSKNEKLELAFSERFFNKNKKINISEKNQPIRFILQKITASENVDFKEIDGQIVFFQKPKKKIKKYTLSGFIEDATSGERLIAAAVFCPSLGIGTVTNEYGFYSLTLPEDIKKIVVSYLGYQELEQPIKLIKNLSRSYQLHPSLTLMEVVVTPTVETNQLLPSPSNEHRINPDDFKAAPDLGGESDLMRIAQLLPGVQTGADGFGGLHVRGGNADQNLVLLDGVPVYNPDHMMGIFSIFNTAAVKNTKFYRGSIPARYGGRASSVMDVRTREGNSKKWGGGAAFDFISGKAFLEGPFAKGKGSLLFTGRLTHSDILLTELGKNIFFNEIDSVENNYEFYDLNAKMNYRFSEKDRLYLSFYNGSDLFSGEEEIELINDEDITIEEESFTDLKWGNNIFSARWNHIFNSKLFANTTFTYSQYNFFSEHFFTSSPEKEEEETEELESFIYERSDSDITDQSVKIDFDYAMNTRHHIRFGAAFTHHQFVPISLEFDEQNMIDFGDIDSLDQSDFEGETEFIELQNSEIEAYIEDEFKLGSKWHFNLGFRASSFLGKENYFNIEPRWMANYFLSEKTGLKFSFTRNIQYLHRILQNEINLPEDVWVPANESTPPQDAWQTTLGWAHKLTPRMQISVEGYYKEMENIYAALPIKDMEAGEEEEEIIGSGRSYGLEFFLKKNTGNWGGWLSYTLAKTDREFYSDSLNTLVNFNSRFDRRHDLKLYMYYRFNKQWNISMNAIYGSPMPRLYADIPVEENAFFNRSNLRSDAYHRVDMALSYFLKQKKVEHTFKASIYNIYNEKNPTFFRGDINDAEAVNLLPRTYGVYYGIKF